MRERIPTIVFSNVICAGHALGWTYAHPRQRHLWDVPGGPTNGTTVVVYGVCGCTRAELSTREVCVHVCRRVQCCIARHGIATILRPVPGLASEVLTERWRLGDGRRVAGAAHGGVHSSQSRVVSRGGLLLVLRLRLSRYRYHHRQAVD